MNPPRVFPLLLVGLAVACNDGSRGDVRPHPPLVVYAAASLAGAFTAVSTAFERATGVETTLNFAGTQQLVSQMEHGARADVFASADPRWMEFAERQGLVRGPVVPFAESRMIVVTPSTRPTVRSLGDLSRPGVSVVLASETVPAGRYARMVLSHASQDRRFGPDFAKRVLANVVSEEDNVKSVLAKVQLGEADAGVVYDSDLRPGLQATVEAIAIPPELNVSARFLIGLVANEKAEAARFIEFLQSAAGQSILRDHGLRAVDTGRGR